MSLSPCTTKIILPTEAAWLAGFFDGEGTVSSYLGGRNKAYETWTLVIGNTHRESILRCQEITGAGLICEKKRYVEHYKRIWMWQVQSQLNVRSITEQMFPYLIVKKEKAAKLIDHFCSLAQKSVHSADNRKVCERYAGEQPNAEVA